MPFIPHTKEDIAAMLDSIGVDSIEKLFEEIPKALRIKELRDVPEGMNEMALGRLMQKRADEDSYPLNFIGAGAYEHHIPAAVWDIASRGEWLTCYTPYQAEAAQGTLQLLYEYQSMMTELLHLDVSNASLYDGASALAEGILMAARCSPSKSKHDPKSKNDSKIRILLPKTVHPYYRQVVKSIVISEHFEIIELPFLPAQGITGHQQHLRQFEDGSITALVLQQPNFFGVLEEVDELCNWAKSQNIMVIAVVNPTACALLKPPGLWGFHGVDIACGEGQPLGIPLASGGPYFGFLACKKDFIRQLPGRLIGRTKDSEGKTGFTLTLQAREQHIRRAKATSNICTNQGLLVTAATIYMSLLGPLGLKQVALKCHENTSLLAKLISENISENIKCGFDRLFKDQAFFHEIVLKLPVPADRVIKKLAKLGIEAGFDLQNHYPELGHALLVCATETKTEEDLKAFVTALKTVILSEEASVC